MHFIINDRLIYTPDDGRLSLLLSSGKAETVLEMTPVLNRLLLLLVSERGKILSFEYLLERIWDDYGREGSMNTLNQYVSVLRRAMKQHLDVDPITRLSKSGLQLSEQLSVEEVQPEAGFHADNPKNNSPLPAVSSPERRTHSPRMLNALLIGATIFLLGGALYNAKKGFPDDYFPVYDIGRMGPCKLEGLINFKGGLERQRAIDRATEIAQMFNLSCTEQQHYYFYSTPDALLNSGSRYSMLTRCDTEQSNSALCITVQDYR